MAEPGIDRFEQAYRKHKDRLLTVAIHLVGDRAAGEDVLHDVFVALAANAGALSTIDDLERYLFRSCVNRARDALRRRTPDPLDGGLAAPIDEPLATLARDDEAARIDGALRSLPANQREVVTLHLHGGLAFREIAELLELSINTAMSRYRYALATLRRELSKRGVVE